MREAIDNNKIVLDVRNRHEIVSAGQIPAARNLPSKLQNLLKTLLDGATKLSERESLLLKSASTETLLSQ